MRFGVAVVPREIRHERAQLAAHAPQVEGVARSEKGQKQDAVANGSGIE